MVSCARATRGRRLPSLAPQKIETFWAVLPRPFWYVFGFAAFTWFVRGEEVQIVFPKSFRLWLLLTSVVMPVYVAVMLGFGLLDSLSKIGRKNFEKLSGQPDNA